MYSCSTSAPRPLVSGLSKEWSRRCCVISPSSSNASASGLIRRNSSRFFSGDSSFKTLAKILSNRYGSKILGFGFFVACDGRDFRRSRGGNGARNLSSSWEVAADNYFSKSRENSDGSIRVREERRFERIPSKDEDLEDNNGSRRGKIRSKYGKIMPRESKFGSNSDRSARIREERRFEKISSKDEDLEDIDDSKGGKIRSKYDNVARESKFGRVSAQYEEFEEIDDSRGGKIRSKYDKNLARESKFGKVSTRDEDLEDFDDSRWSKNRSNYGKIVAREPRFGKVAARDEDLEDVDDSRWSNNRSKYDKIMARESRYEKPEVARWNRQENWGRNTWKQATESTLPKIVGEFVYGVNPILAALTSRRREFYALYLQEGMDLSEKNKKKKDKKSIKKIINIAEEIGLTIKEASKHDLNMVSDNRPHQGLILDASPLEMVMIRELDPVSIKSKDRVPIWIALDEIMDPQNLGAIIRSSYFFGVEGVILCAKNSAPLSGVVSKASAGSLEMIELRSCKNMMQFLASSADNGWRVLGGSVSKKAVALGEVSGGIPTVIVLGSEGKGLRPLVERSCTDLVRIPGVPLMGHDDDNDDGDDDSYNHEGDDDDDGKVYIGDQGPFMAVESLNVSVAAGVLLYHLAGNAGVPAK